MRRFRLAGVRIGSVVVGAVAIGVSFGAYQQPVAGPGVVAADHELASQAGAEMLRRGGNAADAAVAAALAAGVVQPAGSGLGGGGFAVVSDGQNQPYVLDFREVAPLAASANMYLDANGDVRPKMSRVGSAAVAVPLEGRGLAQLLREKGRLKASDVAGPAIKLAAKGYPVGRHLAKALLGTSHSDVQRFFSGVDGLLSEGSQFRNPALAATLRRWVRTGGEDLHTGLGASLILEAMDSGTSVLAAADLRGIQARKRDAIFAKYKGYTLITMPPPSSGGVVLAQVLAVLETFDLQSMGHNSSDYIHVITEAMKHAYADRAHHLGDPDFVKVRVSDLLSDERIDEVRGAIYPGRTFSSDHYGPLIAPPSDGGTQHISVLDADGMGVGLTTTINTGFGSGIVAENLGIVLNNQMDDFSAKPGEPNAYGLVGNAANAIAPGKKPLSSMTPTVVLDANGQVVMVLGASGGSTIISGTIQAFLNMVEFGMDPQAAVSAPRFHHQWIPDRLFLEPDIPDDVIRALRARGHTIDVRPGFTSVQAVQAGDDGRVYGGSDPRKGGSPAGP